MRPAHIRLLPALALLGAAPAPGWSGSPQATAGRTADTTRGEDAPAWPVLLLADTAQVPQVSIAWTTAEGDRVELMGEHPYGVDADREEMGENISAFVAVGGARLIKGAGHPRGAIVRVGFYKIDYAKPFFRGLPAGGRVEVRLSNVAFNQPVDAHAESIVQHLKYSLSDLESCGIPGRARDQFNTASAVDTLNDRVSPGENARLGSLSGDEGSRGSGSLTVEEDGTVTLAMVFEYPLLRHLLDPWESELPGTFIEPVHFHVEFEALPEGVAPLDHEALRARRQQEREAWESNLSAPELEARRAEPIGGGED